MYEFEGEVVPEDTDDDVAADLRNARALEYLRTAAETAVLCGSYLVTGENQLQYACWYPRPICIKSASSTINIYNCSRLFEGVPCQAARHHFCHLLGHRPIGVHFLASFDPVVLDTSIESTLKPGRCTVSRQFAGELRSCNRHGYLLQVRLSGCDSEPPVPVSSNVLFLC